MANAFTSFIGKQIFDRPAQKCSYDQIIERLQANQQQIDQYLALQEPKKPEENLAKLRHIIAIECWAQERLKVALGEQEFELDRSKSYEPSEELSWNELKQTFSDTRAKTFELAQALREKDPQMRVEHNTVGPITAKGWLRYIAIHGAIEAKRIK